MKSINLKGDKEEKHKGHKGHKAQRMHAGKILFGHAMAWPYSDQI